MGWGWDGDVLGWKWMVDKRVCKWPLHVPSFTSPSQMHLSQNSDQEATVHRGRQPRLEPSCAYMETTRLGLYHDALETWLLAIQPFLSSRPFLLSGLPVHHRWISSDSRLAEPGRAPEPATDLPLREREEPSHDGGNRVDSGII